MNRLVPTLRTPSSAGASLAKDPNILNDVLTRWPACLAPVRIRRPHAIRRAPRLDSLDSRAVRYLIMTSAINKSSGRGNRPRSDWQKTGVFCDDRAASLLARAFSVQMGAEFGRRLTEDAFEHSTSLIRRYHRRSLERAITIYFHGTDSRALSDRV